jgi:hypothetical protein
MNEIIYLSVPYSGPIEIQHLRSYKITEKCAELQMQYPEKSFFSPITHSHILSDFMPLEYQTPSKRNEEFWLTIDEAFLNAASELWVYCLPGWAESVGVQFERDFFERQGKVIRYIED